MGQQLYTEIWKNLLPDILHVLKLFPHFGSIKLEREVFAAAGKREEYNFTLEITDGKVTNNADSVIAKNLVQVFLADAGASDFADDMYIVIRLDKTFTLHLSAMKE